MRKLEHFLNEKIEGRVSKKMRFEIDINSTKHAIERLNRKDKDGNAAYEPIEFKEVNSVINKATPEIIDKLVKDKMDINKDRFILQRENDGLTVVGIMGENRDELVFTVITLFRGDSFRVSREQKNQIIYV